MYIYYNIYIYSDTEQTEDRQQLSESIGSSSFVDSDSQEESPEQKMSRLRYLFGVIAAIVVGLFNGSLQVPLHYYGTEIGKNNTDAGIR